MKRTLPLFITLAISITLTGCTASEEPRIIPLAEGEPAASATSTAEVTQTPSPVIPTATTTFTATTSPTPTEIPLIPLATSFSRVQDLPEITLEQLTTGLVAATEHEMLKRGLVKPLPDGAYLCKNFRFGEGSRSWDSAYFHPQGDCDRYYEDPDLLPTRSVTFARMKINGSEIVVIGNIWLNEDDSYSFIHSGFESWQYKSIENELAALSEGNAYAEVIGKLVSPDFAYTDSKGYGLNLNQHKTLVEEFYLKANGGQKRSDLLSQWAEERSVPEEMERMLFLAFIYLIE